MMSTKRSWALGISVAAGLATALVAVVYLAMEPLVSRWLDYRLRQDGLRCDHVWVDLSFDLQTASLEPLECSVDEGNLREVELAEGAHFVLDGTRVASVRIPELRQVERRPIIDDLDAFTQAVLNDEVPSKLRDLLNGLADLSTDREMPHVHVDQLRSRYRDVHVRARDIDLHRADERLELRIARVAPTDRQDGFVKLRGQFVQLSANATPQSAELGGRFEIDWSVGPIDGDQTMRFRVAGAELDSSRPRYDVELDPTPVTELRKLFDDVGRSFEEIGHRVDELASDITRPLR